MAVSGSLKLPPPPYMAKTDPAFNRWLIEVLAVLGAAGGIDPTKIQGWNELVAQVAANTDDIKNNLDPAVQQLQLQTSGNATAITNLQARNQVYNGTTPPAAGLGIDNDWYYNRAGAAGARLYIRVAGAWVAQAI
jgi:hypothetical protein